MVGSARAMLLSLVLLAPLVAFAPPAGAEIEVKGEPPFRPPVPGFPQLSCTLVFEHAGTADCEAKTRVGLVNEITVRTHGPVVSVRGFVDNKDLKDTVASFQCPPTCKVKVPYESGNVGLYFIAETSGAAVVSVWLEHDPFGLP